MAKYLVISDIHQDDRALEQVLKNAKEYDAVWCLGDIVGHKDYVLEKYDNKYSGDAHACYEMLRHVNAQCIIGNWEMWLLAPEKDIDKFSDQHKYAEELDHARKVFGENGILKWIKTWEENRIFEPFTLVHGSIDNIDNNGYQMEAPCAVYPLPGHKNLIKQIVLQKKISTPHMLFGHTHIPGFFEQTEHIMPEWHPLKVDDLYKEQEYNIFNFTLQFFINPGSIGLNRTDDRRDYRKNLSSTALEIDTKKEIFRYLPVVID